jgi:hypothetical protein
LGGTGVVTPYGQFDIRQFVEDVLGLLALAFFDVFLAGTGRLLVKLFSFGRWRGEQFGGKEGRTFAPAGALSFALEGRRVITRSGLVIIGVVFYLALIACLILTFEA